MPTHKAGQICWNDYPLRKRKRDETEVAYIARRSRGFGHGVDRVGGGHRRHRRLRTLQHPRSCREGSRPRRRAERAPFTVFAPTDEAFAKLPAGTLENLLKPENKEKL